MAKPQEAGFLDRVFNSTIGLPQQVLWRIWRIIEDDEIDLFDEAGLADAALLPGVGVFDSHKKDVMPDYMSKQLGLGEGFLGQLTAAIATDPLTYASGGATGLAKVGLASSKAVSRSSAVGKLLRAGATKEGKKLDDFLAAMTPEQLRAYVLRARKKAPPKEAKQLTAIDREIQTNLVDAERLAVQKGLGKEFTIKDALKHTRDRQIALGIPGLATLGAKYNVFEGYSSWWQLFKDGTNKGGTSLGKALLLNKVVEIPSIKAATTSLTAPLRHLRAGYKVGHEARVAVRGALGKLTKTELKGLRHYLNKETGGATIVPKVADSLVVGGRSVEAGLDEVTGFYEKFINAGKSHEDAFKAALQATDVVARGSKETGRSLWGRLSGAGSDATSFPSWQAGASRGKVAIRKTLAQAIEKHRIASLLNQEGKLASQITETKVGKLARIFEAEQKELPALFAAAAKTTYNTARAYRGWINKTFKTGEKTAFGEKEYATFLASAARDNDQLEVLATGLQKAITSLAGKDIGITMGDYETLIYKLMELDGLPEEIAATFQAVKLNPSNPELINSLNNFMQRQRSAMTVIEKMLHSGGIKNKETRDRLIAAFSDDVFTFLEREAKAGVSKEDFLRAKTDLQHKVSVGEITQEAMDTRLDELRGGPEEFLRGLTSRLITTTKERVKVYSPNDQVRLKRVNNAHIIKGGEIAAAPGSKRTAVALRKFRGKIAGELKDAEIDAALEELTRFGQRALTQEEIVERAHQMPALTDFATKHNLSVAEAVSVFARRGKGASRTAKQQAVTGKPPLWKKGRLSWTADQTNGALAPYGFRMVRGESGRLAFEPTKVGPNTLYRKYGLATEGLETAAGTAVPRKTYGTYREAMDDMHAWLGSAEGATYTKQHIPDITAAAKTTKISASEITHLRKLLKDDALVLSGRHTEFSDEVLTGNLAGDYDRLNKLKERRSLPKSHTLHEAGPIVPKIKTRVTSISPPRTDVEIELKKIIGEDSVIPEGELSPWAINYARGRILLREVTNAVKRAQKAGMEPDLPPQLLAELEEHVRLSGQLITDMTVDALPKSFGDILDVHRKLASYNFDAAKRAGTWIPGSPVGYLARYFSKESRARIAAIMGDIEQTDADLLLRLGVKQAHHFGRHSADALTVDDINAFHRASREAMHADGADPAWKSIFNRIENELEEAGMGVVGLPGKPLAYKDELIQTDPFLSLMQRLGAANQDRNLEQYWESLMAAGKQGEGSSLMLGGRVIAVIDDTGVRRKIPTSPRHSTTARQRSKAGEAIDIRETTNDLEYSPQSILIEAADGQIHQIDNKMVDDTGFGILDLGSATPKRLGIGGEEYSAEALSYTPTLGKSFAAASMRSDLHESLVRKAMTGTMAEGLLGNHVVFGAQNVITSSVKSAARVHAVASPAMRMFDTINYMIKSFQTIFRLPFHVANLSSGVFQAHLAGASPKNILAAYSDTMRLLGGNQEYTRAASMLGDLVQPDGEMISMGWKSLLKGERSALQSFARLHGGGDLARFLDEDAISGAGPLYDVLNQFEELVLRHADGSETSVTEFMKLAGEMQLYGTFSSSLVRGSHTLSENLVRAKLLAMDPSLLGGGIRGLGRKTIERMRNISETSEVVNRTATALALVREGHPMRRAIEIAKEAHVPYEKLTPREQTFLKRFSVYYTFPRHYMPWAWTRFMENPQQLAGVTAFLKNQSAISTQEGKANLVLGDFRIDAGRLNANMEAAMFLGAFADRVAMPVAETVVPGIDSADPRLLGRAMSDGGLTSVGGIASLAFGSQSFGLGKRTQFVAPHAIQDAIRLVWPVKMVAQMMGKEPTTEERSPFVNYTKMESLLTDSKVGLGLRKVQPQHELRQAMSAYRKELRTLQLRYAATTDSSKRERYASHMRMFTEALSQIHAETQQKYGN